MLEKLIFEFGEMHIYKDFVIAIMKEGINVKPEYNIELIKIAEKYFANRPFGYITYRKNSYSVDPMIYRKTSEISNLVGFVIVCEDESKIMNIELEKRFLEKPFRHFTNLDDAKKWIKEIVREHTD